MRPPYVTLHAYTDIDGVFHPDKTLPAWGNDFIYEVADILLAEYIQEMAESYNSFGHPANQNWDKAKPEHGISEMHSRLSVWLYNNRVIISAVLGPEE